ncbi:MAG: type II toxin-antitoxin system VapB family antitoxin [Nitrospirales bacterium]|nr:type II toxin-antitoxin system VapB family antitoxin [Nitrospirales bacterium]
MKTTVDIPQSLLDEAKKLAANHRTTVKALIEEGLRRVISEHQRSGGFAFVRRPLKEKVFSQAWKGRLGKTSGNARTKVAEGDCG